MGNAHRCQKCGRFGDGQGWRLDIWNEDADRFAEQGAGIRVALCAACAAPYLADIQAIATTKHEEPKA